MQADAQDIRRLLKTARGQVDGLLKMVDDDRYCIDIVTQIQATRSVLARAQNQLLLAHLDGCVRQAFLEGDEQDQEAKLEEIRKVLEKTP